MAPVWKGEERMRTTTVRLGILILALLSPCAARAQDLARQLAQPGALSAGDGGENIENTSPYGPPTEALRQYGAPPTWPSGTDGVPTPACLSNWITYSRPQCCGPLCGGPIGYEAYVRTGPSLPVAGGRLHDAVEMGWFVEGGARVLFFDPPATAAWTVDLSISNTFNRGHRPNLTFQFNEDLATVRNLYRTGVNVAFGREWYLAGDAFGCGRTWRIGVDGGGRYETARVDLNDFLVGANATPPDLITPNGFATHYDVVGGILLSAHTDVEWPLGGCKLQAGFRVEWDYTWIDLLHHASNDISDVNFLLTVGVRF